MEKTILRRGKRASEQQKNYLIDFLELHVDLAHDRLDCIDGGRNRDLLWNDLADQLNALGGANKDGQKWRKFWLDLKQYTKERNAQISDALSRSGVNGTKAIKPLTEIEKRTLAIMTPQAVDGDIGVQEIGVEADIYEDVTYLVEDPEDFIPEQPIPQTSQSSSENQNRIQERRHASASQASGRPVPAGSNRQPPTSKRRRRNISMSAQMHEETEKFLKIEESKIKIEEEKLEIKRKRLEIEKQHLELEKEKCQTLKDISNSLSYVLDKLDMLNK